MNLFNRIFSLLLSCLLTVYVAHSEVIPKREFRGAWLHTVGNGRYKNMSAEAIQKEWCNMLDTFQMAGVNTLIFQVRPQADAFYKSNLEPWSRYLTGEQGKAPDPEWDPLAFLIEQCHRRGMQLHAWLNPYRVTSSAQDELSKMNKKHAKLFIKYGHQLYFDPGKPESRKIVCNVIEDIVKRYDVDGIHFDDYFYPYPIKGEAFNDNRSFKKYAKKQGFGGDRAAWRRNNVDQLIQEVSETIHKEKAWVVFGISPFGIFRNINDTPDGSGSRTDGLSNYDNLYANVLLWQQMKWIDYVAPQLYWKIGHEVADYAVLIDWWSKNTYGANLYIGQNISTFNVPDVNDPSKTQFAEKMRLMRETPNIQGNIWWSGVQLLHNPFHILDTLAQHYQKYPSLQPLYQNTQYVEPQPVKNIRTGLDSCRLKIAWEAAPAKKELEKSALFCIYRFSTDEPVDLNNATKIVKITPDKYYLIGKNNEKAKYVVTSLNRLHNESAPSAPVFVGE